jgi:divalent metal cation (Fe/Co/Zn/Cd) transporter
MNPDDPLRTTRRLAIFTIAWNVLEAAVSIAAGWLAGSPALLGFGVDAGIESASGLAVLWRAQEGADSCRREEVSLRLVGISFLLLAAWIGYEAIRALLASEAPSRSAVGIAMAVLSLLVMPWLARRKREVGRRLGSRAVVADSRQTSLCAYLSAILLAGLLLNGAFGWWWADPVAALAMTPIIIGEGLEALRGEECDACG